MKKPSTIRFFAGRPKSTAALAAMMAGLGFIFISGLAPLSPNRIYLPGHEWIMAIVCWGFALVLSYCGYLGFRRLKPSDSGH